MSWRDVSFEDLKSFCKDWKSKKDFMESFLFTEIEARHCFTYLTKLKSDFEFREKMNDKKRRSHEIRSL